MTLTADEFIRRFLLHVLPEGFQRIRYYGFLCNRYREQKLAHCRELLGMEIEPPKAREHPTTTAITMRLWRGIPSRNALFVTTDKWSSLRSSPSQKTTDTVGTRHDTALGVISTDPKAWHRRAAPKPLPRW